MATNYSSLRGFSKSSDFSEQQVDLRQMRLGQTEHNFQVVDTLLCDWQLIELFPLHGLGFALKFGNKLLVP